MKNMGPFKKLKARSTRLRISLLTQTVFLLSLFFTCLCGHHCEATTGHELNAAPVATGCCSSCPDQETPQETNTDCDCCVVHHQSEFVDDLTVFEAPSSHAEHVARIIEWLQPLETNVTRLHTAYITDTSQGPPPYLRFETFLI